MRKSRSAFRRLLAAGRGRYLVAMAAVALATMFAYVGPLLLRGAVDALTGNPGNLPAWLRAGTRPDFFGVALAILAVAVAGGLFTYVSGRMAAQSAEAVARDTREALYHRVSSLSFTSLNGLATGDVIQRATSDLETVRRFLAVQLLEVGRGSFLIAFAVPFMVWLDPGLALICLPLVPILVVSSYVFQRKVEKQFKAADEAEGRFSTVLQENLSGIRVVRAFARQAWEVERYGRRNAEYRDLITRLIQTFAAYWSTTDLLSMLQILAVLATGTLRAANGTLSVGTLLAFLSYQYLILFPVRMLGRILADLAKARVSADRIAEILDMEPEDLTPNGLAPDIVGDIRFDGVSFAYGDGPPVLTDLSFHIRAGETVAILGPTGSGKTSLVQLILRLYEPVSGSIFIDGLDSRDLEKRNLRRQIGYVMQEPFLFARSIRHNIRFASATAADADTYEAARAAALHENVMSFDRGYDTLVGERGVTLSGGQKQRLAIARALITGSPILILDDSLSAVDTATDRRIREELRSRAGDATTIIISHRVTSLMDADHIMVLEDGRISDSGTHDELVRRPGLYQRVWEAQQVGLAETGGRVL